VDFAKTREFTTKNAEPKLTRRIVAILANTKNDKSGTGPVSGRTFVLPCICMESLESAEEKLAWAKTMKKEPSCPCITPCPFAIIDKYLQSCPKAIVAADEPLSFMRAISPRGENRRLLTSKLGKNQAKKSIEKVLITVYN